FILLAGAPSHVDTFDLKVLNGTTPSKFEPTMMNGVNWPMGILPQMGSHLGDMTIVRSVQAHALVHSLSQQWTQIGRNPAAALGNIAPNIGSVCALELDSQRKPGQVFPAFIALNSPSAVGNGYFPATFAPFRVIPAAAGLTNTTNPLGQTGFNNLWSELHEFDDPLRVNSPYGTTIDNYDQFYSAANQLMYNSVVAKTFGFSSADSMRYGNSGFGNACLVAQQILAANQGTRFIQITFGSWDMHVDIYGANNPKGNNLFTMCPQLDTGVGQLLTDLKASGMLEETLVVIAGEFGRTVGPVTGALGRDHLNQQSIVFAGGGVAAGKIIGQTTADGGDTLDFGWTPPGGQPQRYVRPEDVEATIYSALGINWTTERCDDPFGRGFEYVPTTDPVQYGPINELWS
ncbi:MAG: DUF1501 domain-containing protein, partial [Acidobacteriota bacterium]|nr:DUF1501 domain-containing protein [Acidobacteriota bacterium]